MADILIRGMEIPKSCFDCIFENRFFGKIGCNNLPGMFANELHAIAYTTERNPFCPLVPIPEGHGRLIDWAALIKRMCNPCDGACDLVGCDAVACTRDCRCDIRKAIDAAPTIVPAEGENADG